MTEQNEPHSNMKALSDAKEREEAVSAESHAEQQSQLPKQYHQFIPVTETSRTYVFPSKEQIKVEYVYGVSIRPDGGHRLLTRSNPKAGFTVAPGWLTIIHEVNDDNVEGYVFTD